VATSSFPRSFVSHTHCIFTFAAQILYRKNSVSYDFIPFLTLVMSALMVIINVLNRLYSVIHYSRTGQVRYSIPPEVLAQREGLDEIIEKKIDPEDVSAISTSTASTEGAQREEVTYTSTEEPSIPQR
jgi:hypothetical protein